MSNESSNQPKLKARWYFGGVASVVAVTITHPLDLIKVHLQTQNIKQYGVIGMGLNVIKRDGFFALYNGISAAIVRQMFYSFPRFGLYEIYKNHVGLKRTKSLTEQVLVAGLAGAVGGITCTPFDVINVRMQNDVKIPFEQRRNYKHVFDGFYQILKHEGKEALFKGTSMVVIRACLNTIGQGVGYDIVKINLMATGFFNDTPYTHFTAGFGAAVVSIILSNPFDVMKTRLMNAKVGQYSGMLDCAKDILTTGPLGFYKGVFTSFVRLGPQTIILNLVKEQLIRFFGYQTKN